MRALRVALNAENSRKVSVSGSRRAYLPAPGGLDLGDVDLLHLHHRLERALGFGTAGRHRLHQHARRDLPGDAPLVLAPAAGALLPAIADDGIPVAVGLRLILGGDLERERLAVLERRSAIE